MVMSSSPLAVLRSPEVHDQGRDWREIYDHEFDKCYRLVLRSGVGSAVAEELVQKAFLVALRRAGEIGQIDNVGAWLRRITLNVVAEHYRWRRVRRLKAWMLETVAGAAPTATAIPEEQLARAEIEHRVTAVLGSMSSKLRDVLVLIEMEGLKPQEAAKVLGCPVNTVRSRRRLAVLDFERRWRSLDQRGSS